jgi:hypothetical protein
VQEQDVAHELANGFRLFQQAGIKTKTNIERLRAARQRWELFNEKYRLGTGTLDALLRAHVSLLDAEKAYARSTIDYALALAEIHYRKGAMLEWRRIQLLDDRCDSRDQRGALAEARSRAREIGEPMSLHDVLPRSEEQSEEKPLQLLMPEYRELLDRLEREPLRSTSKGADEGRLGPQESGFVLYDIDSATGDDR